MSLVPQLFLKIIVDDMMVGVHMPRWPGLHPTSSHSHVLCVISISTTSSAHGVAGHTVVRAARTRSCDNNAHSQTFVSQQS